MAILTVNALASGDISINGTETVSIDITWENPTISGKIVSCALSGDITFTMEKESAIVTINGDKYIDSSSFSINLGTSNDVTSITVIAKGNKDKSIGTISLSNLVYTLTYEDSGGGTGIKNIYIGNIPIDNLYIGGTKVTKVYLGDIQIYGE